MMMPRNFSAQAERTARPQPGCRLIGRTKGVGGPLHLDWRGYLSCGWLVVLLAGTASGQVNLRPEGKGLRVEGRILVQNPDRRIVNGLMHTNTSSGLDSVAKLQARFDAVTRSRLRSLELVDQVTDEQKRQLEQVSNEEQKQFLSQVEEVEAKMKGIKPDDPDFGKVRSDEMTRLRHSYEKLESLAGDRMFDEALERTLTGEQFKSYQEISGLRSRNEEYRFLKAAIHYWSEAVGLSSAQRAKLWTLLVEDSHPFPVQSTRAHPAGVWSLITQVPEERLKSVLEDYQWRVVSPNLERIKAYRLKLAEQQKGPEGQAAVNNRLKRKWALPADPREADRLYGFAASRASKP